MDLGAVVKAGTVKLGEATIAAEAQRIAAGRSPDTRRAGKAFSSAFKTEHGRATPEATPAPFGVPTPEDWRPGDANSIVAAFAKKRTPPGVVAFAAAEQDTASSMTSLSQFPQRGWVAMNPTGRLSHHEHYFSAEEAGTVVYEWNGRDWVGL